MTNQDPKTALLVALNGCDIEVTSHQGKMIYTKGDYAIEVEGNNLYKLLQGGQVIAPFAKITALCEFIKMDMQLNEED